MRPHNKSTLWEEFLEHPVKEQKYFNTKHKKAYCKRCIHEKLRQIEESEEYHKEFQQSTNITADWEEWKELKGRYLREPRAEFDIFHQFPLLPTTFYYFLRFFMEFH